VGTVVILWLGGLSVMGGRLSLGELIAFNNYLMIGMGPLLFLGNLLMMAARAEASAERILDVFDTESALKIAAAPHRAEAVRGQVSFDNVSFHYSRRDKSREGVSGEDVLHNISFEVQPGQQIALLGATGSGKSTLVNLIPRFYDVSSGEIRVDGINVRDWDPSALRSQIGMVLQETILFSGTVRENIAFGRPDATQAQIEAAAQAAAAHDFIVELPHGYDTDVAERGTTLSGGQKQRVAIARALLLDPRILILDDSTSSVDLQTERRIQQALDQLMQGRTSFVIAQRISTVRNASQILVLDQGRLVGRGTHEELIAAHELYAEIFSSQLVDDDSGSPLAAAPLMATGASPLDQRIG